MLNNKDNYNIILDDMNDNIIKYVLYFASIINNFYNKTKDKYIFNYGINIIHHIYNYILLYTKNISYGFTLFWGFSPI